MRMAYADPPYIGQAKRHYGRFGGTEVDHAELISRLVSGYPDGWALSASSASLQQVLALCPPTIRVAAWCRTNSKLVPGVNPLYGWEPVIFCGGRPRRRQVVVFDWLVTPREQNAAHFPGAKPQAFSFWLFSMLNLQRGDTLDDLFPGTGAVGRAFVEWQLQRDLFETQPKKRSHLPRSKQRDKLTSQLWT